MKYKKKDTIKDRQVDNLGRIGHVLIWVPDSVKMRPTMTGAHLHRFNCTPKTCHTCYLNIPDDRHLVFHACWNKLCSYYAVQVDVGIQLSLLPTGISKSAKVNKVLISSARWRLYVVRGRGSAVYAVYHQIKIEREVCMTKFSEQKKDCFSFQDADIFIMCNRNYDL
jgi:hypothetical protein